MRNNVRLQVIPCFGAVTIHPFMPLTGFAGADFNRADDDSGTWGDPVEN